MKNIFRFFLRVRLLAVFLLIQSLLLIANAEEIEIDPVEVTATRMERRLSDAIPAVTVITKEEIVRSNAGDISELLAGQAGMEFARSGGVGAPISIYMRGSGSTQTMVLVDGIPFSSEDATGAASPIHMIPIGQINRVEIIRGNASAIYGSGAMGGVINLITKPTDSKGLNPSASITYGRYNSTRSSAGFDGGNDDISYSFSAAHNQSKGFGAVSSSQYSCTTSGAYSSGCINPNSNGYQQNSIRASIVKIIDSQNSVGVKIFHTDGKSSYDNYFGDSTSQTWDNKARTQMSQFYSKNKISSEWTSTFSLSHSQNDTKTLTNGVFNSAYGRYITDHEVLSWTNSYSLTNQQLLSFGYEKNSSKLGTELVGYDSGFSSSYADGSTKQKAIKTRAFMGLISSFEKISTQFNLSHDMLPGVGNTNTYLLGVAYTLENNIKVTATNSTAVAAPTLGQLYDLNSGGVPTLKPEYSKTTEVGVQYLNTSTFARAVIFDTKYRNLIAPGTTAVDDAFWGGWMGVSKYENISSSHNTGLELQFRKQIYKFKIDTNLTHQSPVNDGNIVVKNKARNYGSLGFSYIFNEKFDAGLGILSTTSRTTTSPKGETSGTHTPGYSVFRLHSGYTFDKSLRGIVSLENALNKSYYQIYGYNTPGRGIYATLQYQPKQ
jgi:vitamin B12 transporter